MKSLKVSIAIGLVLLLAGCALTDSTLKLRCENPNIITTQENLPTISVGTIVDARKVDDDPNFVYFKNANRGKTQGRLISADSDVSSFTTSLYNTRFTEGRF